MKKDDSILSLEMSLDASAINNTINSSEGFFVRSITIKSRIWTTIHCTLIQLFFYSRSTKGCRSDTNLPEISAKSVLSFVNTAFTLLAR